MALVLWNTYTWGIYRQSALITLMAISTECVIVSLLQTCWLFFFFGLVNDSTANLLGGGG